MMTTTCDLCLSTIRSGRPALDIMYGVSRIDLCATCKTDLVDLILELKRENVKGFFVSVNK